jgi:hypothetical protein
MHGDHRRAHRRPVDVELVSLGVHAGPCFETTFAIGVDRAAKGNFL